MGIKEILLGKTVSYKDVVKLSKGTPIKLQLVRPDGSHSKWKRTYVGRRLSWNQVAVGTGHNFVLGMNAFVDGASANGLKIHKVGLLR